MNIPEEALCKRLECRTGMDGKTWMQFLSFPQMSNHSHSAQVLERTYCVLLSPFSNPKNLLKSKKSGLKQNTGTLAILFLQKQSKGFLLPGKRNNGKISKAAAKLGYSLNSADEGEEVIFTLTRW